MSQITKCPLLIISTVLSYDEKYTLSITNKSSLCTLKAVTQNTPDTSGMNLSAFLAYDLKANDSVLKPLSLQKIGRLCTINSVIFSESSDDEAEEPESAEIILNAYHRARLIQITSGPPYFITAALVPEMTDKLREEIRSLRKMVSTAIELSLCGEKLLISLELALDYHEAEFVENIAKAKDFLSDSEKLEVLHSRCEGRRIHKLMRALVLRHEGLATKAQLNELEHGAGLSTFAARSTTKELLSEVLRSKMPRDLKNTIENDISNITKGDDKECSHILPHAEFVLSLPWVEMANEPANLEETKEILERDHFGLEKVKKRIVEFLAVRKLKKNSKGPILCLNGPPGVGKTSIASSIADSLGLPFQKIALAGINDLHEFKGHRRTYVGALPGILMESMKKARVKNPVILLDEIDKADCSSRDKVSNVLLEVLDPEQSNSFLDIYVNYPFDISNVLFITTSNMTSDIPDPLRDRLEIIDIPGYTESEKINIAERHLLAKELIENGLGKIENSIKMPREIVETLIREYTNEAGVRELRRHIGALCRSVAVDYYSFLQKSDSGLAGISNENDEASFTSNLSDDRNEFPTVCPEFFRVSGAKGFEAPELTQEYVAKILGPPRNSYMRGDGLIGRPGVAVGLAVSGFGGNLCIMEARFMKKSGLKITGRIADVMKESIEVALACANSLLVQYCGESIIPDEKGIHIHFPEGAVEKDGPSAGVAICCCFISLLTGIALYNDVAMSGEITLHGNVLPVGGIISKLLAAAQSGIKKVFLPAANFPQLTEVPDEIKSQLDIQMVSGIEEIVQQVFIRPPFKFVHKSKL